MTRGDSLGAPAFIQIANTWLIVYFGGGPTPDKPSVTLSAPADPDMVSSFRIYVLRIFKRAMSYGEVEERNSSPSQRTSSAETCCYIRDPDGYIIEVGQSKPGFTYG